MLFYYIKTKGDFSDNRFMKYSRLKIVALLFFILIVPFFFSNAEKGNNYIEPGIIKPFQTSQEILSNKKELYLEQKQVYIKSKME